MVKRKDDEPADKAAERLKQLLDARRPVPEEKQEEKGPEEKQAGKQPTPEKEQPASDEPKCA